MFVQMNQMGRSGIKWLVMFSLFLILMGVLMLKFPEVLALIVSSIFFLIAFISLNFAWKLYRLSKNVQSYQQQQSQKHSHTHVEVIDVDEVK